ncbi:hypothetical protein ARMGADRAFT_1073819 [Armillaria gallica]|uniref:Uncharacterized protein n=1 Tax=Armillaria gallica TaxID=47427 RepID=A0A2H3EC30_ARMGA|nr:hypothetical protein ARMGADRAFT_1073819 [Armillaria gallica]
MSLQAEILTCYWNRLGEQCIKIADLDKAIEMAQLHGIYTGIISVVLWNICRWNILAVFSIYPRGLSHTVINKSRSIGGAMVAVIVLLYITTTINFFLNGPFLTVTTEVSFQDYSILALIPSWGGTTEANTGIGVTAVMSTVIADCTMIWRCWMVCGQDWLIVLFPILWLVSGFAAKILEVAKPNLFFGPTLVFYPSCILATTLWCTILIIIRILTVTRGANGRLGDYHHIIEVLVESSALYSVTLIIYIALEASNNTASEYFDTLAVFTTGIAPTLLAGRVAAGHARPDDSWEGSIISSLRFGAHPRADAETYSQVNSMINNDLEAQSIQVDEPEETGDENRI